jgi:hypothetical protein
MSVNYSVTDVIFLCAGVHPIVLWPVEKWGLGPLTAGRFGTRVCTRSFPKYSGLVPPSIEQVVVARSTGSNRPNCEFRVLLRSFAATAWKIAETSPWTLARTDLTASPWQRPVSHFRPHPAVSGETVNCRNPLPTALPWFGTLWRRKFILFWQKN